MRNADLITGTTRESAGAGASDDDATLLALARGAATTGFWSWDLTTDTIWYSTEMYRLHGVAPGELGERLEDYLAFVHPEDRARVTEAAVSASTGRTLPIEFRFVHPEGGIRHLLGHAALVRDRAGIAQRLVGTVQDFGDIRRARRNVTEAVTRLSSFFEEMPTPAYLWRREGDDLILRRFNKAATARWGERVADLMGSRASEFCADRPDIIADINECMVRQVAITRETDYTSRGLGPRRLVITYVPVGPDSVVAHTEDISELLSIAGREQRATAQLAEYFQRVPTPAYLWRMKGGAIVLEAANAAGMEATNGRVQGIIGERADDVYADAPDVVGDLRRAFAGETFTREFRYRMRLSDDERDLVVTYVHIPPDAVAAHTMDVTEQRRTQQAIGDREAEMTAVIERNPDGICLITGGRITVCNGSLAALIGCTPEKILGRRLHDLMSPADRKRAQERGRILLEGGPAHPGEYDLVRCDGSYVPVEIYGAAFDFRGDRALICTLRDVGMRKAAELELAESRDALRALTQHLETVREEERVQVARDLHDELGSVLTALKIDLAEALEGDAESARELVMGMSGLVDQAIEVGRRVTARLRPGILDDLGLAAAAEWLGTDLERRTGIRCSVVLPRNETDLPEPVATTMFRILQEALTNVIRHAGADRVEIALESDDTGVALTVVDNGRGFDPAALTGSGFGLLGMRERVRSFGGVFDVTSGPGAGTSIRVALPVAPSA
jgi:PAS domain S-box-containing protein